MSDVDATFDDYVDAFYAVLENKSLDKVVTYFNIPGVLVNPTWGVIPFTDEPTLRNVLQAAIDWHAANSSDHSDFLGRETKILAPALATISYTEVVYNTSGAETQRVGGMYTFIKVDDAWRIAAIHNYDSQV